MVLATDKSTRTAVKRPTTIGTDFIRRVGLSDIYLLTPGSVITVSVNKRGGLYAGAVVYTTDLLPNKHSIWTGVSTDNTDDVADAIIPTNATGVAFICSAVTEVALPRVGAEVAIKDANVADNLTAHNRVRHYSGDIIIRPHTEFVLQPPQFAGVQHWFDFTDQATVWNDTSATVPALDGQFIRRIDNKGSDGQPLIEAGDAVPNYETTSGINGLAVAENPSAKNSITSVLTNAPSGVDTITFASVLRFDAVSGAPANPLHWHSGGAPGGNTWIRANQTGTNWDFSFNSSAPRIAKSYVLGEWLWIYGTLSSGGDLDIRAAGSTLQQFSSYIDVLAGAGGTFLLMDMVGAMAESIIWGQFLNTQDQTDLVTYFDAKYPGLPFTP